MMELRHDWLMRQFIDNVLATPMPVEQKRQRMHNRGVPLHVQERVLNLLAEGRVPGEKHQAAQTGETIH